MASYHCRAFPVCEVCQPLKGRALSLVLTGADDSTHCSLDGEVKLGDIRGGDNPAQTWDMFPSGLSAFDVHEQTEVFAAYVMIRAPLSSILTSSYPHRTSSLSASNWRAQRTEVQSLETRRGLGSLTTGLSIPPPRDNVTPFTPRTSSLAFHPREMVYGAGFWDGSGGSLVVS